jgi:phosphoenolpyruvate-protein kinase (PTS system EI component)
VVEAAHAEGKWVGVCGELAGNPLAVPVLVGLGVDELSLNSSGIPLTKSIVRAMDTTEVNTLAKQILETEGVSEVRRMLQLFSESKRFAS